MQIILGILFYGIIIYIWIEWFVQKLGYDFPWNKHIETWTDKIIDHHWELMIWANKMKYEAESYFI